jgi:oligopeptide transport system substrate-binding protein
MDRSQIVEKVLRGGQQPADHFVPNITPNYSYTGNKLNSTVSPKDIEEAKKLLAEAGYPEGKGFPKVQLLYNTSDSHKNLR